MNKIKPSSRPKGKKLVMSPVYRCRQEVPKKGKGSYHRKARYHSVDNGFFSLWLGNTGC